MGSSSVPAPDHVARALRWAIAVGVASLLGCAGAHVTGPRPGSAAPLVVPLNADAMDGARAIAERARGVDVVYLGEQHDNPAHHQRQRQILEAIVGLGARPIVGFEMLDETQQATVSRAVAEPSTAADLEQRLGWRARGWPDFAMYWPIFELARDRGLTVVALDLEPRVARRIARERLKALGTDGAALGSALPADPEREAAVARAIRDGHCGLLPEARLPGMIEAWDARNVTIARRIAAALERGRPVVVIIGRGHQDLGGVPAQLDRLRPGTRQLVVSLVEAPANGRGPSGDPTPSGDVTWITPGVERDDPCLTLRRPLE